MIKQGEVLAGRYQIMEQIGQGGTGVIYKAYDRNLMKYVVVKKIRDGFAGRLEDRAEVDILKRLHHPYLPQVYDFLKIDRQVYTVMDYVEGRELKWYQDHHHALDERTVRKWLMQLLEVLSYLHRQVPKIIHGDIKPGNIMATDDGNICLIDFNISLGDGDGSAIKGLSRSYAAPEQIKKAELARQGLPHQMLILDERTDIYSLGKSFYAQMKYGRQRGISYSDALWTIIERAMQKSQEDRYKDAEQMLYAVKNIEKTDKEYRRYYKAGLAVHGGYALCLIAAALLIYTGYHMRQKEQFSQAYDRLIQYTDARRADQMIRQGIHILNMPEFTRKREKGSGEAPAVLGAVADGYYIEGQYEEAARYYEKAIGSSRDISKEPACCADYVIALVKAGKTSKADRVWKDMKRAGVAKDYLHLAKGELLFAKGEEKEALETLNQIVETGTRQDAAMRACVRIADIFKEKGELSKACAFVEKAREKDGSPELLRKLAQLYYEAGRHEMAADCYKVLADKGLALYEDCINYAVCCESGGDYSRGIELLKKMCEEYPDSYEAYMHLALSSYKLGKTSQAAQYYKQAEERYKDNSGNDALMEELKARLG